jgi:hypothetical protein
MAGPSVSPHAPVRASESEASYRTWRNDPDRYIRVVKGGKYQARPHDSVTGERDNLGLFHTRDQARKAIRDYWAGRRKAKPKFVRRVDTAQGSRYFLVIPSAGPEGKKWIRVGGWFDTEDEAAAAVRHILVTSYGRIVAEAMLSRRDTSRRGRRMT